MPDTGGAMVMGSRKRIAPGSPSAAASWKRQPPALRILRAFLGVTFLYAGIQKIADPTYLRPGTPAFIGSQLAGFADGTPLGWLLRIAAHAPVLTGLIVAFGEIAIGLGTLSGIAPLAFASAGLVINLVLFLTATWHVRPYFLGSDSIYAIGWLAYLAGVVEIKRRFARVEHEKGPRRRRDADAESARARRQFLRGALLGIATLAFGGVAAAFEGRPKSLVAASRARGLSAAGAGPARSPNSAPASKRLSSESGRSGSGSSPARAPAGVPIGRLDQVPVGGAFGFQDPSTGDPSALVRLSQDHVVAYSRVCTHSGCLVRWDGADGLLVCPCHGAEFDPARGASPIAGPARRPLPRVRVAVDPNTGEILAQG